MRFNSRKMDTRTEVKKEDVVKSEIPFTKHLLMEIKTETVPCSNNWETDRKTEIEEHTLVSDSIKEEPFCLERETSNVRDAIMDGHFPPVKSSRVSNEIKKSRRFKNSSRVNTRNGIKEEDQIKSGIPFTKHLLMEIKTETVPCSNNWEIDRKTEIEEQTLVSDLIKEEPHWLETETSNVSENVMDGHFPPVKSSRVGTQIKNSRRFNNSSKINTRKKIKEENLVKSGIPFTRHLLMEIKTETVPCSSSSCKWETDRKTEIEEQTLVSDLIKEEPCWQETEASNVCEDDAMDGHFSPVKSSRLCMKAVSGAGSSQSPLPFPEVTGRETRLSTLKKHNMLNEDKKSRHCKKSDRTSTQLANLKRRNWIYNGKKPHQCTACDMSFTQLSSLKKHNLLHESEKPHHCKICDCTFTQLSSLKRHNLIHEGRKPHHCKAGDTTSTQLSTLKTHTLIHEGKMPYECKTCDMGFTWLSSLRRHNSIHQGSKAYQCKNCGKSFRRLLALKIHHLLHEGKKPHHCKTCDRSYTQCSNLKRHNMIHEGRKPQKCKTCDKN